jgi:hypothetical protein
MRRDLAPIIDEAWVFGQEGGAISSKENGQANYKALRLLYSSQAASRRHQATSRISDCDENFETNETNGTGCGQLSLGGAEPWGRDLAGVSMYPMPRQH